MRRFIWWWNEWQNKKGQVLKITSIIYKRFSSACPRNNGMLIYWNAFLEYLFPGLRHWETGTSTGWRKDKLYEARGRIYVFKSPIISLALRQLRWHEYNIIRSISKRVLNDAGARNMMTHFVKWQIVPSTPQLWLFRSQSAFYCRLWYMLEYFQLGIPSSPVSLRKV